MNRRLILIIWMVIVGACTASVPASRARPGCDIIVAIPFRDYISKPIKLDDVLTLAENAYSVRRESVVVTNYEQEQNYDVEWLVRGVRTIVWINNGILSRVTTRPENVQITAGQVIECIDSKPIWYWAAYGPDFPERPGLRYTFEIWYPNLGLFVSAHGSVRSKEDLPDISPHITIENLVMIKPGSIEEVHDRVFYNLPLEKQPPILHPKPWPGDWSEMHFIEERNYTSW